IPARRHTSTSAVNLRRLPDAVSGVRREGALIVPVPVRVKDEAGVQVAAALPKGNVGQGGPRKGGGSRAGGPARGRHREVESRARLEENLSSAPLAGFVGEGMSPYGYLNEAADAALRRAVFSGLPVVKVGRGNAEGFAPRIPPFVSGSNLTATKARLL